MFLFKSKKEKKEKEKSREKKNDLPSANEGHSFVGSFNSSDNPNRKVIFQQSLFHPDVPPGHKTMTRYDFNIESAVLAIVPENFELPEEEKKALMYDGPPRRAPEADASGQRFGKK